MNADVTQLLDAVARGHEPAANELLQLVYSQLHQLARAKMAREKPGQTLQTTALVHEAWMRLGSGARFETRGHFFAAAAEAMRRILVERARRKQREKRGAHAEHVNVDDLEIAAPAAVSDDELLAVHEALDRLAAVDPRKSELVKLRYFVGLSFDETAAVLGISVPTANRDWAYARAWLHQEIRGGSPKAD
jgi:RNA polymerase sigma factor (TIGR02999 family)